MNPDYAGYSAARMIQYYPSGHTDAGAPDDYLVKKIDAPHAVFVFNRKVIVIGNDGTIMELARK
jgi:hypothetical protein